MERSYNLLGCSKIRRNWLNRMDLGFFVSFCLVLSSCVSSCLSWSQDGHSDDVAAADSSELESRHSRATTNIQDAGLIQPRQHVESLPRKLQEVGPELISIESLAIPVTHCTHRPLRVSFSQDMLVLYCDHILTVSSLREETEPVQ